MFLHFVLLTMSVIFNETNHILPSRRKRQRRVSTGTIGQEQESRCDNCKRFDCTIWYYRNPVFFSPRHDGTNILGIFPNCFNNLQFISSLVNTLNGQLKVTFMADFITQDLSYASYMSRRTIVTHYCLLIRVVFTRFNRTFNAGFEKRVRFCHAHNMIDKEEITRHFRQILASILEQYGQGSVVLAFYLDIISTDTRLLEYNDSINFNGYCYNNTPRCL